MSSTADCPSCARYVGPYQACPYCGTRMTGRVSLSVVKIAAALLATVGLVALWYVATRVEIPTVAIGQVDAGMNLAYVRLAGRCTRAPSYDPRTEYLSFWIADDTGALRVVSYRAASRALLDQQRLPALADHISVAGTLRVEGEFRTLTINAPDQLVISRPEAAERPIGSLGFDDYYQRIRVRGQVRNVRQPYPGLTLYTLRDLTGAIDVAVSRDLIALSHSMASLDAVAPAPLSHLPELGQSIEVVGVVSRYGDTLQLVPAWAGDLIPLDHDVPVALERAIGDIGVEEVGRWFTVNGTVARIDPFSAGVKLHVDDASGTIRVLLWDDLYEAFLAYLGDGPRPTPGATVQVQGRVSEYRGEAELMPTLPGDIRLLTVPGTRDPVPIGTLSAEDLGRWVTVRGTLGTPERFTGGIKLPLSDESGSLTLLLWADVHDALPMATGLVQGVQIQVTGEIREYRRTLEIVPQAEGLQLAD